MKTLDAVDAERQGTRATGLGHKQAAIDTICDFVTKKRDLKNIFTVHIYAQFCFPEAECSRVLLKKLRLNQAVLSLEPRTLFRGRKKNKQTNR